MAWKDARNSAQNHRRPARVAAAARRCPKCERNGALGPQDDRERRLALLRVPVGRLRLVRRLRRVDRRSARLAIRWIRITMADRLLALVTVNTRHSTYSANQVSDRIYDFGRHPSKSGYFVSCHEGLSHDSLEPLNRLAIICCHRISICLETSNN